MRNLCMCRRTRNSTSGGYKFRIRGSSFGFIRGSRQVLFSTYHARDFVVDYAVSNYPAKWVQCLEEMGTASRDEPRQHHEILCTVPTGVGSDLNIVVAVGRSFVQFSNFANFSYDPPTILYAKPTPIDAMGQEITFYGTNLADNRGVWL